MSVSVRIRETLQPRYLAACAAVISEPEFAVDVLPVVDEAALAPRPEPCGVNVEPVLVVDPLSWPVSMARNVAESRQPRLDLSQRPGAFACSAAIVMRTSSARLRAAIFSITLARCTSTVRGLEPRS